MAFYAVVVHVLPLIQANYFAKNQGSLCPNMIINVGPATLYKLSRYQCYFKNVKFRTTSVALAVSI